MRTRGTPPFSLAPEGPGSSVRRRFQVMIKAGGAACNLDCAYCYYLPKRELFRQPPSPRMSDAVLEAVIRQYIEGNEHDSVVFSWQGGEPCLLGLDFFAKALRLQEKHAVAGKSVENTLQTNGTLITDEWAAFLKRHNFLVGLSVDGPEALHDMCRKDTGGRPSFARVMEGHGHLRRHGVPFAVLTTVHRHNAKKPLEVYRFVTREAAYDSAKAQEEQAAVNLSYASITAPITGRINRSAVDAGAFVSAGSTLLTTIYRTDPIRAEFSITDREFSLFTRLIAERGGNPGALLFRLSLGDERTPYGHTGVMEMADPVLDPKTNTMGIRVLFPNPDNALRPGMYANVTGVLGVRDVLSVPDAAVVDRAGGKAVFMVNEQSMLVAVPVEIGAVRDGRRIILKGLSSGQKVVVEGLVQAQPGMRVELTGGAQQ